VKKVPAFQLRAVPLTDEAAALKGLDYAAPDVGTRHRIGGESPLRSEDDPACGSCNELMTFYGQLDSIGEGFELADVGLIAVFVCFDCFTTESRLVGS